MDTKKVYMPLGYWRTMAMSVGILVIAGIIIFIATGGLSPYFKLFMIGGAITLPIIVLILGDRKIVIDGTKLKVRGFQNHFKIDISDITYLSIGSYELKELDTVTPIIEIICPEQTKTFKLFYATYDINSVVKIINYILSINSEVEISHDLQLLINSKMNNN